MNKFEFYSNGDPWCTCWHCLSCGSYDTYEEWKAGEMIINCYDCKENQKLMDMKNITYTNKLR